MSRSYNWRMYEGDRHIADAQGPDLPKPGSHIRVLDQKSGRTTHYTVLGVKPDPSYFETSKKLFGFLGVGRLPFYRIQLEQAKASRARFTPTP